MGFLKIIFIQNKLPITFGTALIHFKYSRLEFQPHIHEFLTFYILLYIKTKLKPIVFFKFIEKKNMFIKNLGLG